MAYKLEDLPGRFGNYFIRNLVFHVLAEKWDFFIEYKEPDQSRRLGIDLKIGKIDTSKYPPIAVDDGNIVDIINNTNITITDVGSVIGELTTDEFNISSSEIFICQELATKNNILFATEDLNKLQKVNKNC